MIDYDEKDWKLLAGNKRRMPIANKLKKLLNIDDKDDKGRFGSGGGRGAGAGAGPCCGVRLVTLACLSRAFCAICSASDKPDMGRLVLGGLGRGAGCSL